MSGWRGPRRGTRAGMLASVEINSERSSIEIRGIEVIFARNPDQGEERLAAGIGEGGSHPVQGGGLADRANRPVR